MSKPPESQTKLDFQYVDVDQIVVPTKRRVAGDDPMLERSIRDRGLICPVIVSPDLTLIIGARRLDQCKKLGWKRIPVSFKSYGEIDRELVRLEETLTQEALNYLERIKQLKRHKELYEANYPETRHGNTKERAAVKRQGGVLRSSFTKFAGKTMSASRRTIQRDIKLAGEISDEAAEKIWNKKVANTPKEVARLAKHDYETQSKLADEIAQGRANDVKGAERNLKLVASSNTILSEFNSKARAFLFELDKANQQSLFQHAVDRSDPNLLSLVELLKNINERTTNLLGYYERTEPRLLDAA